MSLYYSKERKAVWTFTIDLALKFKCGICSKKKVYFLNTAIGQTNSHHSSRQLPRFHRRPKMFSLRNCSIPCRSGPAGIDTVSLSTVGLIAGALWNVIQTRQSLPWVYRRYEMNIATTWRMIRYFCFKLVSREWFVIVPNRAQVEL